MCPAFEDYDMSRSKYGICRAQIHPNGLVEKREPLGKTFEGSVGPKEIEEKIIPYVEEKGFDFPVMVYAYWSKNPSSKTANDWFRNPRRRRVFPRNRQDKSTIKDEWVVVDRNNYHQIEKVNHLFRILKDK